MDIIEAINERKSIRAYKKEQIPRQMIEEVLKLAIKAPSAINMQPWEIYVIAGEEKNRLSRVLLKAYREKQIKCGPGTDKPLPTHRTRDASREEYHKIIESMGIPFEKHVNEGSCNFYGAPVAIILCIDKNYPVERYVDVGIVLGYLLLIAHAYELGTCPIGLLTAYEDEIKEELNIPDNKKVVIGVAIGYPDTQSPLYAYKSSRESLDKFVKWVD